MLPPHGARLGLPAGRSPAIDRMDFRLEVPPEAEGRPEEKRAGGVIYLPAPESESLAGEEVQVAPAGGGPPPAGEEIHLPSPAGTMIPLPSPAGEEEPLAPPLSEEKAEELRRAIASVFPDLVKDDAGAGGSRAPGVRDIPAESGGNDEAKLEGDEKGTEDGNGQAFADGAERVEDEMAVPVQVEEYEENARLAAEDQYQGNGRLAQLEEDVPGPGRVPPQRQAKPVMVPLPPAASGLAQRRSWVGLDIGSSALKVVQVLPGSGGPAVYNFGQTPAPPGTVKDGVILNVPSVAEAIKRLMTDRRVIRKAVRCAVGGSGVLLRHAVFPTMPRSELKEVLQWEAEQYIPIPLQDVVMDFAVLNGMASKEMQVLIVGAQRRVINGYVETLKGARLWLGALEAEALAQVRAIRFLGLDRSDPDEAVAIVDFGASATRVTVVAGEFPRVTRTIGIGGEALTRTICERGEFDRAEAEELKKAHGLAADSPIRSYLEDILGELLIDICRSLDFFIVSNRGILLGKICLVGGGARLKGLEDALRHHVRATFGSRIKRNLEVLTVTPGLGNTRMVPRLGGVRAELGPEYVLALGLALREERRRH